jgi:hypothetical protein
VNALLSVRPVHTQVETFHPTGNQHPPRFGEHTFQSNIVSFVLILFYCRWLYVLILTINVNFRLKNKDHKVVNDLPLGDSWAHWVPHAPYHEYLDKYILTLVHYS